MELGIVILCLAISVVINVSMLANYIAVLNNYNDIKQDVDMILENLFTGEKLK